MRILLADDLDVTRSVTTDFLRTAGHAVTEVCDGLAAVEAARTGDFDLILTDMRMPIVDGLEATRRIRALPGDRGRTPVVLLTADLVALGLGASGKAGVTRCLLKPFTRAELLDTVAHAAAPAAKPNGPSRRPTCSIRPCSPNYRPSGRNKAGDTSGDSAAKDRGRSSSYWRGLTVPQRAPFRMPCTTSPGISGMLGLTALSSCLRGFDGAQAGLLGRRVAGGGGQRRARAARALVPRGAAGGAAGGCFPGGWLARS